MYNTEEVDHPTALLTSQLGYGSENLRYGISKLEDSSPLEKTRSPTTSSVTLSFHLPDLALPFPGPSRTAKDLTSHP